MATNNTNPPFSGRLLNFMYSMRRYWTVTETERNPPETIQFPELKPREREDVPTFEERMSARSKYRHNFSGFGNSELANYFRTCLDAETAIGSRRPDMAKAINKVALLLVKSGVLDLIPVVGISPSELLWKMSFGHMQTDYYKLSRDKYIVRSLEDFENGSIGQHVYIDHFNTEADVSEVARISALREQCLQDLVSYLRPVDRFQPEHIETCERDLFSTNRRVQYPVAYCEIRDESRNLRIAVYSTKYFPKQYRHGEINVHAKLALVGLPGDSSGNVHLYFKLSGKKRRATLFKVSIPERNVELSDEDAQRYGKRLMKLFGEERLDEYRDMYALIANHHTDPDPHLKMIAPTRDELEEWSDTWSFSKGVSQNKFGTRIYFYPHARALPDFPEIGVNSKAVVIYFGGSGTPRSSGANAMRLANALQRYDISTVGFDYPFHAQGPYDRKYLKGTETMGMMRDIVMHYASAGLPVYMVGHSMGPSRIQELLHTASENMERRMASGALMFSPAVCTERQREIYANLNTAGTVWMIDGAAVEGDPVAEEWEQAMDNDTVSLHGDRLDIHVPVRIVASDDDPYSTPEILDEIAKRFPKGTLEIIKGLGHAGIFEDRVKSSGEVLLADRVLRFIEEVTGEKLSKSLRAKTTSRSMIKYLHHHSGLFRKWLRREGKSVGTCLRNEKIAGGILEQWEEWIHYRVYVMAKYVMNYKLPENFGGKKLAKARRILAKAFKDISRDDMVILTQVVIASR